VRSSTIRGPAIIGAGTEITDSYIGPFTSIQKNCRIVKTEIEHSIVLEGSEIVEVGARIGLIGREVDPGRPAEAYRSSATEPVGQKEGAT
jgi:glucose-1-phosphate thymidylyltransferase